MAKTADAQASITAVPDSADPRITRVRRIGSCAPWGVKPAGTRCCEGCGDDSPLEISAGRSGSVILPDWAVRSLCSCARCTWETVTREALKLAQPAFFPQAPTLFAKGAAAELLAALPELRPGSGPPSSLAQVLLAGPPSSVGGGAAAPPRKEPPAKNKGEV